MKTKKVILTLLMAMAFSLNGVAQKGMNGIGINIPVGTGDGFTWVGVGVKYQYNISDYFRIEPSFEYSPVYSKKDYLGVVDDYNYIKMNAFLNGHIFLMAPRPIRPYVLLGAGFTQWGCADIISNIYASNSFYQSEYSVYDDTEECFSYHAGLGCDFRLTHNIAMQIEATAFSSAAGSGTAKSAIVDHNHNGKWYFVGRLGFAYTF